MRLFVMFPLLLLQGIISTTKALSKDEVSMGTTIVAVRYKGGIAVGADTRTSVSGYVSNRYAAKLTFVLDREIDEFVVRSVTRRRHDDDETDKSNENNLNENSSKVSLVELPTPEASTCVICRSGSAADTQHLASVIRTEIVSRQLLYRIRGTVTHVAALLRNLLVNEPNLSASLICAGYDHELKRGVIYSIAPGGTVFEESMWAAGGSGSTYILGHLDSCYPKHASGGTNALNVELESEEEAVEFICKAIGLAMDRDGSSGGFIRMYVIDRFGRRFISRMPNAPKNESVDKNGVKSAAPLKHFAPAIPAKITNNISRG